jgi:4-hydroxyacetophenone monooxygenase
VTDPGSRDVASPDSREELLSAVSAGNIPVLLMLLVHLTGDKRWLEGPFVPARQQGLGDNETGGLSEAVQQEIRLAARDAVEGWLDGRYDAAQVPAPDQLTEMLSVAMGEPVPTEYGPMLESELRTGMTDTSLSEPIAWPDPDRLAVVVIGAGITGLCAAVACEQAGLPYVVLERNEHLGGVWAENSYPGAGVDTPSTLYSFSFAPYDWSRYFAPQEEIKGYLDDVADRFGVRPRIRLGAEVTRATYDEKAMTWQVDYVDADGHARQLSAPFLLSGVGIFNPPKWPDIPGLEEFPGPVVHTAQWRDEAIPAHGRVAVIGNGASAMQVVPAIADRVDGLVVFQREPHWVAPFEQFRRDIPAPVRTLLDKLPLYRLWYRLRLGWTYNDRSHAAVTRDPSWPHQDRSLNAVSEAHRSFFIRYLTEELGDRTDLIETLTPSFPPYGKRILLDNGWYRTLTRPDVELVTAGIDRVDGAALVTADGSRHEVASIVLATGFDVTSYLSSYDVVGRGGRSLLETWGDQPEAFLGVSVPGFPNFFALYGPNTQPHGGSVIFTIEAQVRYALRLIGEMVTKGIWEIEVRRDVWREFNEALHARHEQMVWTHPGMHTYFRNESGRVVVLSPYRMVDVWSAFRLSELDDYDIQ